jgi:Fe2+ or Zn2+ uptake regulation protein
MGTVSLKTVYQTLKDLAAMGEIASLDLGTGTIRFDPNVDEVHQHLVCRSCGKIRDLHAHQVTFPPEADRQGFEVTDAEVVFRGLCADCQLAAV